MSAWQETIQALAVEQARAGLRTAEHLERKAKAEADLAEFCLEHVKKNVAVLKLPDMKGVTS